MSKMKNLIQLFALPFFMFYASTASCYIPCNPESLRFHGLEDFIPVRPDHLVILNNTIGVVINNQLHQVQAIEVREDGNYHVKVTTEPQTQNFVATLQNQPQYDTYLYGRCPNGHPYDKEGGCLGWDCPFSN